MTGEWSKVLTLDELTDAIAGWNVFGGAETETVAAFALLCLLGDLSELSYCAWVDAIALDVWRVIVDPTLVLEQHLRGYTDGTVEDIRRCRLLAEVSGWWWASYDYAVPLAEWEAKHGALPRGDNRP
jgi:hypothetical protein